jgi:hypothetical protein
MAEWKRRDWLTSMAGLAFAGSARAQEPGERPSKASGVRVLNPRGRVPVSLIIDDSTCLANLAHFCIPQFAEVFPDQYKQDWRSLPREIPDSFVREFGEWCHEHGIKGKYSIVPYPACVGWVDRDMPGWSRKELEQSLELVRALMMPDWDIHPEMITHTWVIDTKTGRPYAERSSRFMENWEWSAGKSADELADYLAYALRILKNAGLACEGITTPGGFGNRALSALSQATFESVHDVFGAEIPHYFRHLYTDATSVAPRVEFARDLDGPSPSCVVSIIGCTGDWFGGWDGLELGHVDQFITEDGQNGRLPEVIARGEPAIMVCHWPGIYYNGQKLGYEIFKQIVARLTASYDHLIWMKLSEIARYWAARELSAVRVEGDLVRFKAPFACPGFTIELDRPASGLVEIRPERSSRSFLRVATPLELKPGTWAPSGVKSIAICFDLPRGETSLEVQAKPA